MAGRLVKCQRCGLTDTSKNEMDFEEIGVKKQKKYYHKSCFKEHLKDKEFKLQESKELDILVEKIKEIYGVKVIPNSAYPYLQDLRNGTRFFGKMDYKYKQGYPYSLIAETFEYCSDTITYWNARKQFNGFVHALRYGLAIVCDRLSIVEKRRAESKQRELIANKHMQEVNEDDFGFQSNYKKKQKSNNDITDFLDD